VKVRNEARREHILEVATQVFLAYGYRNASCLTSRYAWAVPKRRCTGYYASKVALFLASRQEGQLQQALIH